MNTFKQKSSVKTWIYRITVNKSLDTLKKNHRRKETNLFDDEYLNSMKYAILPNDLQNLRKKEQYSSIYRAIEKLPDKYKVALTLKDIENLSYDEISKIMKISINKVKIWLFRARQKVRKEVENEM